MSRESSKDDIINRIMNLTEQEAQVLFCAAMERGLIPSMPSGSSDKTPPSEIAVS